MSGLQLDQCVARVGAEGCARHEPAQLRIGIVAPEFPPEIGGMQTYAYEFARELVRRGGEVTVFTKAAHAQHEYGEGFEVRPVLTYRRWRDRPELLRRAAKIDVWHVMTAAYAWMALDCDRVVVSIHGNDFIAPPASCSLDLRQRLSLPFGSRLDYRIGKWRTQQLLKRSFLRVRHVFANSRYTEAAFLRRHPRCRGRTEVAFVGLPEETLQRQPEKRSRGLVASLVTTCRLSEPRKNVDRVLQALARLKGRCSFHYTVVGDGSDRPRLEELVRQLDLSDHVSFLGFVSSEALRKELEAADLFILASSAGKTSFEGFGICYLEANAAGTPVLAARAGGAVDAVDEGISGFFVDEPSVEQIEQALEQFLRGEVQFDSEKCRGFASQFRWSTIVKRALTVYSAVCNGRKVKCDAVMQADSIHGELKL